MSLRSAVVGILFVAGSVPLARLVAVPELNPLPICVVLPVLAAGWARFRAPQNVPLWVPGLSVTVGATVGTMFAMLVAMLDYGAGIFPKAGVQLGRVYYGWDILYGAASATVGAFVAVALLAVLSRRTPPVLSNVAKAGDGHHGGAG